MDIQQNSFIGFFSACRFGESIRKLIIFIKRVDFNLRKVVKKNLDSILGTGTRGFTYYY